MKEIEALQENFRRAYYGISFTPEIRADQCVKDFSEELTADLSELGDRAGDYAEKYVNHLRTWAGRKSRCMSTMITGPANFPTERNRRAFNSEQSAWEDFRTWRERYIKRAFREPTKSPEEEIDDALILIEKAEANHARMVGINRIIRKKNMSDDEKLKMISAEYEMDEKIAAKFLIPDWGGCIGIPAFTLTNSNARIKSLKEKLVIMRNRIIKRDAFETITFPGGSIAIEDDRVIIRHDTKPGKEIIEELKGHGFHWSPKGGFWCRKHTANAISAAKGICGIQTKS